MCAAKHVTLPLRSAHPEVFNSSFDMPSLLLLLCHLFILVPLVLSAFHPYRQELKAFSQEVKAVLLITHQSSWLMSCGSPKLPWLTSRLKTTIDPCCMCSILPLPTIPQSGLLKIWKGFQDVYRITQFYCVHFRPLFILDLPALPEITPLDLDLIFIICHDVPYPRHIHAQHHAPPHDFQLLDTDFSSHMTLHGLSPAASLSCLFCLLFPHLLTSAHKSTCVVLSLPCI